MAISNGKHAAFNPGRLFYTKTSRNGTAEGAEWRVGNFERFIIKMPANVFNRNKSNVKPKCVVRHYPSRCPFSTVLSFNDGLFWYIVIIYAINWPPVHRIDYGGIFQSTEQPANKKDSREKWVDWNMSHWWCEIVVMRAKSCAFQHDWDAWFGCECESTSLSSYVQPSVANILGSCRYFAAKLCRLRTRKCVFNGLLARCCVLSRWPMFIGSVLRTEM